MHFDDELIYREVMSRQVIKDAIDSILMSEFITSSEPNVRVKRGIVNDAVSNGLNVKLNNQLCSVIRERVVAIGGKAYISQGRLYYKFLGLKG